MNAELLSDFESCERRGYWSQDWEPNRLHATEILRRSIAEALTDSREDKGEHAGEIYIAYCGDRGLDTKSHQKYDIGVHHACLADILTTYLARKGQYTRPDPKIGVNLRWDPWCLRRGEELVRIVLVDHWNDDRQASEARAWWTLGEMAAFKMPMTLEVILLGASSNGKRHSAFTKGLLHPRNRALRFKKQTKKIEGFAESWIPVYREDYNQISREQWLDAMEKDDVFRDATRTIHVDALQPARVQELRGIIERKTGKLYKIGEIPDPVYSSCSWPRPCVFQKVCFADKPTTPEASGLYRRRSSG